MRVFLDANILFSASDPESATRRLLRSVVALGQALTSPHAWEEARRNIEAKRPQFLQGLDGLRKDVETTHAFHLLTTPSLPDKDQPILAGAVGARCTHLWTSDRTHFGGLYGRMVSGVKIVSSVMLAEEIQNRPVPQRRRGDQPDSAPRNGRRGSAPLGRDSA